MKISYFARKSKPSKHIDIPFHKICDIVATKVHTAVFTFTFFWFGNCSQNLILASITLKVNLRKQKLRSSEQNFKEADFSLYKGNASEIHSVYVEQPTKQHQH